MITSGFFACFWHRAGMGKKRMLSLAVFAVALLGSGVWLSLAAREPEPIYQGRLLSYWLAGFRTSDDNARPNNVEAEAAVTHLGTYCLPTLIRKMEARDSAAFLLFADFAYRFHLITEYPTTSKTRNWEALRAFGLLGARASNAVPALIKIYEAHDNSRSSRDWTRRYFAAQVLGGIGQAAAAAVPALSRYINREGDDMATRQASIEALGQIHAEPALAVPALIHVSESYELEYNVRPAIRALGAYGEEAKAAIPKLYDLLKSPETYPDARDALLKIDPDAPAKLQQYPPPPEAGDGP